MSRPTLFKLKGDTYMTIFTYSLWGPKKYTWNKIIFEDIDTILDKYRIRI